MLEEKKKSIIQRQEQAEEEFIKQRRQQAETEEEFFKMKDQAIRTVEEIGERGHYYLQRLSEDTNELRIGMAAVDYGKDELVERFRQDQKKLEDRWEQTECTYNKAQRECEQELEDLRREMNGANNS